MVKQIAPLATQADGVESSNLRIRKSQRKQLIEAKKRLKMKSHSKIVETSIDVFFALEQWYKENPTDTTNPLHVFFSERFAQTANENKQSRENKQ